MNEALTDLVAALCLTLLHFLWQGVVIGAVAWLALRKLANAGPQARYAVACTALLVCLLTAAITLAVALMPVDPMPVDLMAGRGSGSAQAGDGTALMDSPFRAAHGVLGTAGVGLAPWLVAAWAAGSGLRFLRLAFGLNWIKRLRRQPPAPREWQERLDDLAARFGLGRVTLVLADGLGSPLSAGWWRPIVLLPVGLLLRLPADCIEALLAHELAHIRRHDYVLNRSRSPSRHCCSTTRWCGGCRGRFGSSVSTSPISWRWL